MRVIPVIDLMNGHVVRGVGGRRDEYRPIESRISTDSHPWSVASALANDFGFQTAYVADLDGIMHGRPDPANWLTIADAGLSLWVDAGIRNGGCVAELLEQARHQSGCYLPRLVIGLESLASLEDLTTILQLIDDPLFSLDLQGSFPKLGPPELAGFSPLEITELVQSLGIQDLIVLDLADVGKSGGTRTLDLCQRIRATFNFRELIAGGGVRSLADLKALAEAGCSGALVASALHDGRLTKADLNQLTTDN